MNRKPWSMRRFITMVAFQCVWIVMFLFNALSESGFLWLTGGTLGAYLLGEGAMTILEKIRGNIK